MTTTANNPVHIIAEAGNNHNGSVKTARELIDCAMLAGADSVKFQTIYPEGLYLPKLYQSGGYATNDVFEKRKQFMLTDDEYKDLSFYCNKKGIIFSSSVFDERGLKLLNQLDVDYIKIASCDLNNYPLLKKAAHYGRKLVISTGMSRLDEIEKAVEVVTKAGNSNIILLHCVSIYPCKTDQMNLAFIRTLKNTFRLPVGLSDHTEDSIAAVMAVALGVKWIEKHFTLDRTMDGFDHAYAMEPLALKKYVSDIRKAERAVNESCAKVGEQEATVKQRARRSLYAARDIAPGEKIAEEDVLIVRPEGLMSPGDVAALIDKTSVRSIKCYEPLELEMFQ